MSDERKTKPMNDSQIVDIYLMREEAAITYTSEKYGSRLYSLAYGIVNDSQTAEECENDTYLAAWNAIPPHEPRTYLYPFLARIVRHISLNICRFLNDWASILQLRFSLLASY